MFVGGELFIRMLGKLFEDRQLCALCFFLWGFGVVAMLVAAGVTRSKFVSFGPSDHTHFLDFKIDTWFKWRLVASFTALDSTAWELAHDTIMPWAMNTLCDEKCNVLPYSRGTCILIVESYHLHGMVLGAFGFFISLTQLDLVLIKGLAHMVVRVWCNWQYMKGKIVAVEGYEVGTT